MAADLYEPEGIYFDQLTEPIGLIVQRWGDSSEYYAQYKYNGTSLSGYFGLGLQVQHDTAILAADAGKVMEINIDEGGLGKYIKVVHWWGESIYALLGTIHVAAGQTVTRGNNLATIGSSLTMASGAEHTSRFHFCVRILPFNRHDGWGGFTDPLPFIAPEAIIDPANGSTFRVEEKSLIKPDEFDSIKLLPLEDERPYMRRP